MKFNEIGDSRKIPLSVPNFIGNELKYVMEAVETGWVSTAGPYVNKFEQEISRYIGLPGAIACQNGTSGLHIAMLVNGVEKEQEVIVPTLTFIAAVNPVRYIGAEPVFIDCDDSLCIDPVKLEEFCSKECNMVNGCLVHLKTNKVIRCLVVVHVIAMFIFLESDFWSTWYANRCVSVRVLPLPGQAVNKTLFGAVHAACCSGESSLSMSSTPSNIQTTCLSYK